METQTTLQGIVMPSDKKKWENPTLVVIDSNSVNSGASVAHKETTVAASKIPTYHS